MLFRIWDKETKKWEKDANITDDGSDEIIYYLIKYVCIEI